MQFDLVGRGKTTGFCLSAQSGRRNDQRPALATQHPDTAAIAGVETQHPIVHKQPIPGVVGGMVRKCRELDIEIQTPPHHGPALTGIRTPLLGMELR